MTKDNLEDDIKLLKVIKVLYDNYDFNTIYYNDLRTENKNGFDEKVIDIGDNYFYDMNLGYYVHKEATSYVSVGNIYNFDMEKIQEKAKEIFNTSLNIQKHSFLFFR